MTPLIAITGGIGSGKSVVCRCLTTLGFRVYDCDSRAKRLMDSDPEILRQLSGEFGSDIVSEGKINRSRLAEIVFSDSEKLARLNAIVHRRVIEDIKGWRLRHNDESALFVETAILLESNLQNEVDRVWLVDADEETRHNRACMRDRCVRESILARMRRQQRVTAENIPVELQLIDNEGTTPVMPRLLELLSTLPSLSGQWKS